MKTIRLIAVALLAAFAVDSAAQLTRDTEEWSRFQVSFDAQRLKYKNPYGADPDATKAKGFAIGYMRGISVTTRKPIFIDLGANIAWNHCSETVGNNELKYTFMNLSIPVNAAYKLSFASSSITIVPFLGPNFKFNFMGVCRNEATDNRHNYLSKDDSGDAKANIFQVGMNLGVGVNLKKLYVGYTFQPDFSPYQKYNDGAGRVHKTKTINNLITLGINL